MELVAPVTRDLAEHGVDQAGEAGRAAVGLREPDRQIDGGMIRHVEPQNLRRSDQQRGLDPRSVGRETLLEIARQQMPQGAEPPQHGRGQHAHQGAVAIVQRRQTGMHMLAVELLVERAALTQDGFEDFGRNAPRRKAGRFDLQGLAGTDHAGSSPQSRQHS